MPRRLRQEEGLDQTCGIEIPVAATGDQIGKSENEEGPRRATFGGPYDGGKIVARDRRLNKKRSREREGNRRNEHGWKKWPAPTSNEAGRVRAERLQQTAQRAR